MASDLAEAYERCRQLHRRHGRTYYLAANLLPPGKRKHVHALYGFTRFADEIVNEASGRTVFERSQMLAEFARRFAAGLVGEPIDDPLLLAALHTIRVHGLDPGDFQCFLRSKEMDLEFAKYRDYPALLSYMEGSAAAIGTMLLPVLGARDLVAAREPARQLGIAFQLTHFIRDVAEDLDRGRIYLPLDDLARFGLTPDDLRQRVTTPAVRELIRFEIARAREHYALAAPVIAMLNRGSRTCMRVAFDLCGGILTEIEEADYDVFAERARVPNGKRLKVAMRWLLMPATGDSAA